MDDSSERDFGSQPLDGLLPALGLENRDLVAASTEQLTHKQVQKARRGRYVTANIQRKILKALQAAAAGKEGEESRLFKIEDLFNYRP